VNGKKVNIPSYLISLGEEVAIKEKMHQKRHVAGGAQRGRKGQSAVPWLERSANSSSQGRGPAEAR